MDFFDKLNKAEGGYIFLSHSHDDIEKVRKLRNALERDGFEPLCFYLKCLKDKKEIADLIKREIDAREWFIFVNSENARRSEWVTMEREYITGTNSKKIITVDIEDENTVDDTLYKIVHNLRVFISHSHKDEAIARKIKDRLEEKDYLVFFPPDSIPAGEAFEDVVSNALIDASRDGCVLALITENSVQSQWVKREILFALHQKGNIIPVVLGDIKLDDTLRYALSADKQLYCLPQDPTDDEIGAMIDKIGRAIIEK